MFWCANQVVCRKVYAYGYAGQYLSLKVYDELLFYKATGFRLFLYTHQTEHFLPICHRFSAEVSHTKGDWMQLYSSLWKSFSANTSLGWVLQKLCSTQIIFGPLSTMPPIASNGFEMILMLRSFQETHPWSLAHCTKTSLHCLQLKTVLLWEKHGQYHLTNFLTFVQKAQTSSVIPTTQHYFLRLALVYRLPWCCAFYTHQPILYPHWYGWIVLCF